MLAYSKPTGTTTTLNDIPPGTVFEGTIKANDGHLYTGIFLKTDLTEGYFDSGVKRILAVSLDHTRIDHPSFPVAVYSCRQVTGYRPLKNPRIVEEG